MSAPCYKVHGVKDGHTVEFPATDDIVQLVKNAHSVGVRGMNLAIYKLVEGDA